MAYRLGHTVKGAADSVVGSLQELIHIGVVLFKGVQAGYRAYLELRQDIDEKGAAAITERMRALGIKIEQGVDKVTALLKQGLSMLNTILSDPYCRGYLFEYFDGLKESISELGRCRMIGGFIGELGLDFIIAIATGGIGLIPRAAQLIGGLSYKVLKVMLKIYDALQAKAGQALEASRVAQRQLDLESNRSIAPKVPSKSDKMKGAEQNINKSNKTNYDFKYEIFIAPKTGKKIKAATRNNAVVPLDKVNIYARGKVPDVRSKLRELNKFKQTKRKEFDSDPQNELLLKKLKGQKHNFERSSDMSRHLDGIGLIETDKNNNFIIDNLLSTGNDVTPDNRAWVPSTLEGPNGRLKVESTWKIMDDKRAYLTTLKLMPIK